MYKYMMGRNEQEGARLFSVVPTDKTGGNGHKFKTHEILSEHEKTIFLLCGQTLEQVPQRRCGISFCGGTKKLTRHNPGQPA